jgi:hypothetical protein
LADTRRILTSVDPNHIYIGSFIIKDPVDAGDPGFPQLKKCFAGWKFSRIIYADTPLKGMAAYLDNFVPTLRWGGNTDDDELVGLSCFLIEAGMADDVRVSIQSWLNLRTLCDLPLSQILQNCV